MSNEAFSEAAAMTGSALGDFAVSNKSTFIDNRIRSVHQVEKLSDSPTSANKIVLKNDPSNNPIDLRGAYIRILGKIARNVGVDAIGNVYAYPFALYNLFESMTLIFGSSKEIEKVNAFYFTLPMKRIMDSDAYNLSYGGYLDEGIHIPDITAAAPVTTAAALGTYSNTAGTHIFNSDGTFELVLPLAKIFSAIASLSSTYKTLDIKVEMDRKQPGNGGVPGMTTGIETIIAGKRFDNGFRYDISQASLIYDEIFPDPKLESAINAQYQSNFSIPCKISSSTEELISGGQYGLTKTLPLVAGKFGAETLLIAFRNKTPITNSGANNDSFIYNPTDFYLPQLTKIDITYAGNTACFLDNMTSVADQVANVPTYKELYENFRECKSAFYSDESQAISYDMWRRQFPIIVINLSNFTTIDSSSNNTITVSMRFTAPLANEVACHFMLLSDQSIQYDPLSRNVLGVTL